MKVWRRPLLCVVVLLSGCATYGSDQKEATQALTQGRYAAAETYYAKALGDSRLVLLRHLEIGMMAHLQGDYERSNQHLEVADRLRDTLLAPDYAQYFADLFASPALGVYRGTAYEYAYINYFKALNYLALARTRGDSQWLDSARVEARRLNIILAEYAAGVGDYSANATEEDSATEQILAVLRALDGRGLDPAALRYRDDAWGRFLVGVGYEAQGEWDNARVSYQQAAEAYRDGYAEQYRLPPGPERMAWTRAVRMMRKGGGYGSEPERLVREHDLDASATQPMPPDHASLLLINHVGRTQDIGELNLALYQRPDLRALELRPLITAEDDQASAQLAWFTLHYADRSVADLLLRYQTGGIRELVNSPLTSKQVPLGPLWEVAKATGVLAAIGPVGIRVAVPWYPPADASEPTRPYRLQPVAVDDASGVSGAPATGDLIQVADLDQAKRQERIRLAQTEMRTALLREILKNATGATAGAVLAKTDEALGLLLELAGRAAAFSSARAETRHWSSLPGQVYARWIELPAGTYRLERPGSGAQAQPVHLAPNATRVITVRTFVGEAS